MRLMGPGPVTASTNGSTGYPVLHSSLGKAFFPSPTYSGLTKELNIKNVIRDNVEWAGTSCPARPKIQQLTGRGMKQGGAACRNKLIIVKGVFCTYSNSNSDTLLTQHGARAGGLSRPPQLLGGRGSGCITTLMFMHVRLRLVCLLVSL